MRGQQARIERAAQQLLEQRLARTTEPLARARLKDAAGVPLADWSEAELLALRAVLPSEPAVGQQQLPDLEVLSNDELEALKYRLERPKKPLKGLR